MAVISFNRYSSGGAETVRELSDELIALKRDLEYLLTHLDGENLSPEFMERNGLE